MCNKLLKFMFQELDTIVKNTKKVLFDYIIKIISKSNSNEILFSSPIEFPCEIDEDRYYISKVKGVGYNNDCVYTLVEIDGQEDEEDMAHYSIDEIIKIASKLTKQ